MLQVPSQTAPLPGGTGAGPASSTSRCRASPCFSHYSCPALGARLLREPGNTNPAFRRGSWPASGCYCVEHSRCPAPAKAVPHKGWQRDPKVASATPQLRLHQTTKRLSPSAVAQEKDGKEIAPYKKILVQIKTPEVERRIRVQLAE